MRDLLFTFRTELERTRMASGGRQYVMIPVECAVHLDGENIPCVRAVVSENAQWFYEADHRGTGEFAAFDGDVLFVSGTRINGLRGDEQETLQGLAESELASHQAQRQDAVCEWDFDQRTRLKRAA